MLFLFYPFRSESEHKGGTPKTYQNKFLEIVVLYMFNGNNQIFEPYTELVEETFGAFNERVIGEPQADELIDDHEILNKEGNVTLSGNAESNRNTMNYSKTSIPSDSEVLNYLIFLKKSRGLILILLINGAEILPKMPW